MGDDLDDLIALPEKRAAALAGVSTRMLLYWSVKGIVEPGIRRRLSLRTGVRLYTFQDTVSLLVAATLRKRGFSLHHVRRVVLHLRSRGYEAPLRELRFATFGKEIYFQHPTGEWEGGARPDQTVLSEVIDLALIRALVRAGARRPATSAGKIERRRGSVGSKPVFAGTRIPVDTVSQWLAHGFGPADVIEAYPDLTEADVDAARQYAKSA